MKRFFIDFVIAFLVIILVFGMKEESNNESLNDDYNSEVNDSKEEIENVKDYNGNFVNRISYKFNNFIIEVCDFGFELFKKALKSFLE